MDDIVPVLAYSRGPVFRYSPPDGSVWPGFPASYEVLNYVPDAAVERAATYAANAGRVAVGFPIDLTPCTR